MNFISDGYLSLGLLTLVQAELDDLLRTLGSCCHLQCLSLNNILLCASVDLSQDKNCFYCVYEVEVGGTQTENTHRKKMW